MIGSRTRSMFDRAMILFALSTGYLMLAGACASKDWIVEADGPPLQRIIDSAASNDRIFVKEGRHRGPVRITKPVVIEGASGSVVDGGGRGRVITVDASDVVVRGLTIQNSGIRLDREDSGIYVTANGHRARIENNRLVDNLIGVYLKGPSNAHVRSNAIEGKKVLRLNERGNGIQIWRSPGSVIIKNDISRGRDGIFVTTSKKNIFRSNRIRHVRFAIHYMYTHDSEVSGNLSQGNHLGYAIMYARNIQVIGNISDSDRDHGILLNYANKSTIRNNHVLGGADKCVFIYNANKNNIRRNRFEDCQIGIHFTAGSERNSISENIFMRNRTQVKYVGTRFVEWSEKGRGNYWSDNISFDRNGDGIADRPYRPNNVVDRLIWQHPSAKLLISSPAVQVLKWTQSVFPALFPGGVTDSAPLMTPPDLSFPDIAVPKRVYGPSKGNG